MKHVAVGFQTELTLSEFKWNVNVKRSAAHSGLHFLKQDFKLLNLGSHFGKAVAAVYRSTFTGLERYLGGFAAFGTCNREHLAHRPRGIRVGTQALGFPCLTASRASLGVIGISFCLEECLL